MKKIKSMMANILVGGIILTGATMVGVAEATPFQTPPYADEYNFHNVLGFTIVTDYANKNKIVGVSF